MTSKEIKSLSDQIHAVDLLLRNIIRIADGHVSLRDWVNHTRARNNKALLMVNSMTPEEENVEQQ